MSLDVEISTQSNKFSLGVTMKSIYPNKNF